MFLTAEERLALESIREFLVGSGSHCHGGYFSHGWAGEQLHKLLTRDAEESKGNG